MADSTLDPTRVPAPPRPKGHGTEALGPSGSSDSGSDLQGPGLQAEAGLGMDAGTTSDLSRAGGAGADVGDANLDSDSDAYGSGETASAGRDALREAGDIAPDRTFGLDPAASSDQLDEVLAIDQSDEEDEQEDR